MTGGNCQGETVESRFEECNSVFVKYTTRCSDICRQIVFALFVVVWSLAYHDGAFLFTIPLWSAMIGLVLYLGFDIGQYLYTSLGQWHRYTQLENDYNALKEQGKEDYAEENEPFLDSDDQQCNRIAKRGFNLFKAKMVTLLIAVVCLFVSIIVKWREQSADKVPSPTEQIIYYNS